MNLHDWKPIDGVMTCAKCGAKILPGMPVPALCSVYDKKEGEGAQG